LIYSEISQVVRVPRGLGLWGDMVVTLKDGNRLELRAVPKYRELYDYIEERISQGAKTVSGAVGS
jgi:nitrogen fixation protein